MPKPPTVWFRKQTGWYMTTVGGVQHKLSTDKAEARRLFYKLMGAEKKPAGRCGMSVRKLCDTYLDRTRPDKGAERHQVQVAHLKAFCTAFGHREPSNLKTHEVNGWLDGQPLGPSTKALAVTIVRAVFNWAVGQDYLGESPVAKLKRRKIARRERVLTPDERRRVLAAGSAHLRDFLTVLEQTGCRPFSEAAGLTAAMIDWGHGRAVLKRHKNEKKGKGRAIYFPPATLARLRELADRHPEGPLLRNRLGNAWTKSNVAHYLDRIGRGLGIEPFVAYDFRHSYICDALVKGVPVEVVAELVGNSPKIIWAHYSHVAKKPDALQAAALKAVS